MRAARPAGRAATSRCRACLPPAALRRKPPRGCGHPFCSAHRFWHGLAGWKRCCPAGAALVARPVDLHLSGLAQMGVHCREEGARLILTAPAGLHGADITLGFPSVGATETLLLAAAAAQGETVLRGAAREPEISDLAAFLNRCGGCVQGAGTSTIRVQGRRMLYSCSFAPMADRIVASTLACACAAAEAGWN